MVGDEAIPGEWSMKVSRAERVTWRVQRIGWVVMAVLVVAALLGISGDGPLAQRERSMPHGMVQWPGVTRLGTPTRLVLSTTSPSDTMVITLSADLLKGMMLDRWIPEPLHSRVTASGIEAVFARVPGDRATVMALLSPERIGAQHGKVSVDHDDVDISILVIP